MKRTLLFLTLAAFIGLNVSTPAQAIYNPLAGCNLDPIKGCALITQKIDKTKLGLYIIGGSVALAAGTDVIGLLYKKVKAAVNFCNEHRNWALAGAGVLAGTFVIGVGVGQQLNAVAAPLSR